MIVFYQEMLGEKVKGFVGIIKLLGEFLGMFDFSDFNEEALKSLMKSISVVIIKSHRSKNCLQRKVVQYSGRYRCRVENKSNCMTLEDFMHSGRIKLCYKNKSNNK